MEEDQMIKIINRYLAGKASGEEAEQIDAWFANADTNSSPLSSFSPQELKCVSDKMFSVITGVLDASCDNEG